MFLVVQRLLTTDQGAKQWAEIVEPKTKTMTKEEAIQKIEELKAFIEQEDKPKFEPFTFEIEMYMIGIYCLIYGYIAETEIEKMNKVEKYHNIYI